MSTYVVVQSLRCIRTRASAIHSRSFRWFWLHHFFCEWRGQDVITAGYGCDHHRHHHHHLFVQHCLCGACQVDVAVSTSSRDADLSIARRLAVARPKLSGRRSSSTVLSQVCLHGSTDSTSPVLWRTQNTGLKSSGMVLTDVGSTKRAEERQTSSATQYNKNIQR